MTRKYQIYLQDIKKDLRPISLTPSVSKVAEEFVVKDFLRPVFLGVIEDKQYWVTPGSSTNIALINMLYHWSMWTDGNSSTVIIVLSDHRKAFDFIDHGIVLQSPLRGTSWDQTGPLDIYLIDRDGHCARLIPP